MSHSPLGSASAARRAGYSYRVKALARPGAAVEVPVRTPTVAAPTDAVPAPATLVLAADTIPDAAPSNPPSGGAAIEFAAAPASPSTPLVRSAVDTFAATYDELMATAHWSPVTICEALERVVEQLAQTALAAAADAGTDPALAVAEGARAFLRHELFQHGNRRPRIILGTLTRLQELLHEDTPTLCLGMRNLEAAIALYNTPTVFRRKPCIQYDENGLCYLVLGVDSTGGQSRVAGVARKRRMDDGNGAPAEKRPRHSGDEQL